MSPQRAVALVFLVLSVGYAALAGRIEETARSPVLVLGPRAFPLIVGASGVVLSLFLLLGPSAAPAPSSASQVFAGDWRRTLALCALALLYAAALPRAGFALSTAAFLALSFRLLGERRAKTLAVVPIVTAVLLLALLRGALGAYLPEPLLDPLLGR